GPKKLSLRTRSAEEVGSPQAVPLATAVPWLQWPSPALSAVPGKPARSSHEPPGRLLRPSTPRSCANTLVGVGSGGATLRCSVSSQRSAQEAHAAQQLPVPPSVPPRCVQPSADDFVLHFAPQSRSTTQASVGFSAHVPSPVAGLTTHVSVGNRQRTNPGLPHVERAAQLTTLPLQFPGTVPSSTSFFTTCATQLT